MQKRMLWLVADRTACFVTFCFTKMPPRTGPPFRRRRSTTRVKGYRTLQCECCGGRFPSGRGLENHRTVSRICYDSYHSKASDRTSGIQCVTRPNFARGLSSVSNSEANRQSQPHILNNARMVDQIPKSINCSNEDDDATNEINADANEEIEDGNKARLLSINN
eukprot:scaffold143958_cov63-Attheya_sp.AAC.1